MFLGFFFPPLFARVTAEYSSLRSSEEAENDISLHTIQSNRLSMVLTVSPGLLGGVGWVLADG